jgi:hypothetical protein
MSDFINAQQAAALLGIKPLSLQCNKCFARLKIGRGQYSKALIEKHLAKKGKAPQAQSFDCEKCVYDCEIKKPSPCGDFKPTKAHEQIRDEHIEQYGVTVVDISKKGQVIQEHSGGFGKVAQIAVTEHSEGLRLDFSIDLTGIALEDAAKRIIGIFCKEVV